MSSGRLSGVFQMPMRAKFAAPTMPLMYRKLASSKLNPKTMLEEKKDASQPEMKRLIDVKPCRRHRRRRRRRRRRSHRRCRRHRRRRRCRQRPFYQRSTDTSRNKNNQLYNKDCFFGKSPKMM